MSSNQFDLVYFLLLFCVWYCFDMLPSSLLLKALVCLNYCLRIQCIYSNPCPTGIRRSGIFIYHYISLSESIIWNSQEQYELVKVFNDKTTLHLYASGADWKAVNHLRNSCLKDHSHVQDRNRAPSIATYDTRSSYQQKSKKFSSNLPKSGHT